MPRHISVAVAMVFWVFAVILILGGFALMFTGNVAGFGVLIFGVILAGVNKLVFKVRTKQLEIDVREAVRDKIGRVCPNCGQRLSEDSNFCNNCGSEIK